MKLKIYVLKKKQLIWTAVVLAIVIISIILFISIRATQTMSFLTLPNSYKADINNDGKIDTVITKVDDKTKLYSINVICSDDTNYNLEPDPVIKSFGNTKGKAPINITFKDVNRDGKEEIFIQASDEHGPIINIYKYTSHNIERIASGRYSMYGLINDPYKENNILVLTTQHNNTINPTYLEASNEKLSPCKSDETMNLGVGTISDVVNLIQQKDVATGNFDIATSFKSELLHGTMLDGIINNVKFSTDNIPVECTYLLRTVSNDTGKKLYTNYKITLALKNSDASTPSYEVYSVKKLK